jgi:hypothetical protein
MLEYAAVTPFSPSPNTCLETLLFVLQTLATYITVQRDFQCSITSETSGTCKRQVTHQKLVPNSPLLYITSIA